MDSLSNESVILTGNSPIGNPGYGYGYSQAGVDIGTLFNEKSAADTRRDVKDSESEVRESIFEHALHQANEFRHLDARLASIDKEALASKYESQITSKDVQVELSKKIDYENNQLRNQLSFMHNSVDKQFADLKTELFKSMTIIRERELQDEINGLRRAKAEADQTNQANSIVTKLLSVLKPGTTPTT